MGAGIGETMMSLIRPISADSHVIEPKYMYRDFIDPEFRERAPYVTRGDDGKDYYVIEDIQPLVIGLAASAGVDPRDRGARFVTFEEMHPGGWDAKVRLEAQDKDGIAAEVVFPTIGLLIYGNDDTAYQSACCWAYNRWLETFCADAPERVFGIGQTALRTVEEGVADLQRMKDMGFKGIMVPGLCAVPGIDYDDEYFDPFYRAACELGMPICFHILTANKDKKSSGQGGYRGAQAINMWSALIRVNQDVVGMFVFGGVFDRHPDLKIVCVEADAGWVPHYVYRANGMYEKHRWWQKTKALDRTPKDYFDDNIYFTFQDDQVAFDSVDKMNPQRLMWANDFPHSDSTWPWSQELLAKQTANLTEQQKRWILRDNVKELYNLPVPD